MPGYDVDGLLHRTALGQRILIATDRSVEAGMILETFAPRAANPEWHIRRANGEAQISHSGGGRIYFRGIRGHGGRGVSVDVIVLALATTTAINELLADLMVAVAASPHGDLVIAPELAPSRSRSSASEGLRRLADRHADVTTVLWIDEDQGGRPMRLRDVLLAEALRIEQEADRD